MMTTINQRMKAIRKVKELFIKKKKQLEEKGRKDIYINEAIRCFTDIEKDLLDERYIGIPRRFRNEQKTLFNE